MKNFGVKSALKLAGIITIALIALLGCTKKSGTATTPDFSIYGVWRYVGSADVEHGEMWHDDSIDLITLYNDKGKCVIAIGNSIYNGIMSKRDGYSHQFNANTHLDIESGETANIEGQGPYTFVFNYDPVKRRLIDADGTVERYFEWVKDASEIPTAPQTQSADFQIVITALEDGSVASTMISELRASNRQQFTLNGKYTKDGFAVTLPKSPNANILFEGFLLSRGTVSDQDAKMFFFSRIEGYDSNGSHVGTFKLYDDSERKPLYHEGQFAEWSGFTTIANFWYADRDITINGTSEGQGYNLNLKKGWNMVYEQSFEPNGRSDFSTTAPPNNIMEWKLEVNDDWL